MGAGTGAGFPVRSGRPDRHAGENEADILGVHDLGAAFQSQQIGQGGLQNEETGCPDG